MSIVRENLLTRPGYTPYCGAEKCAYSWPRTYFDGSQFACACGWKSGFEAEFIEQYKRRAGKPKIKKLHSWGGQARAHDFEMTDGTIETLTEAEAELRR